MTASAPLCFVVKLPLLVLDTDELELLTDWFVLTY